MIPFYRHVVTKRKEKKKYPVNETNGSTASSPPFVQYVWVGTPGLLPLAHLPKATDLQEKSMTALGAFTSYISHATIPTILK